MTEEQAIDNALSDKLREAVRIDINGIPQYGSRHQVNEFIDFCMGYHVNPNEFVKKKHPEKALDILRAFDNRNRW